MLKNRLKSFLASHHFWRDVDYDELSEIYLSRLLTSLGMSVIGIFVPIFLYREGVSVFHICLYFVVFYFAKVVTTPLTAHFIARYGPKHGIISGQIAQIGGLFMLMMYPEHHWPLALIAITNSVSAGLYFLSFHVDFSKIKHTTHGGKEIGVVTILDKSGAIIGPAIGGIVATAYGAKSAIALAAFLLVISLWPLMKTGEVVKTHQHLDWGGLWRGHWRDHVAQAAMTSENSASLFLWPLYLAVIIGGTQLYANIGIISSISVMASIIVIQAIGSLIDKKRGGMLFRYGVLANSIVHFVRPLVTTIQGALLVNIGNEPATNAYRLPIIKATYDATDGLPGQRITYLAALSVSGNLFTSLFWLMLAGIVNVLPLDTALRLGFVLAGVCSLGLYLQNYATLRVRL